LKTKSDSDEDFGMPKGKVVEKLTSHVGRLDDEKYPQDYPPVEE
jgi:hypothetical protein